MKSRLLLVILILVATGAYAQSLKDLDPFVGTWKCTGIAFASEMSPEHATRATVPVHWALDGKWLEIHYTESKTSKNPHPVSVIGLWGYDAEKKKLVAGWVDSMGGYSTEESSGWEGDKMTFTGPNHVGTMTVPARDVFERKGNQLTHTGEMQEKSGAWKKVAEETCKK